MEPAELGVMLLVFGVGQHFSPREPLAVRGIAVPGAIGVPFETGRLVERARASNPRQRILARAENEAGRRHLLALGTEAVVLLDGELARALVERFLAEGRPR